MCYRCVRVNIYREMFFISSSSSPFNDFLFYKERETEFEIFSNGIVCITIYIIVVDVIIPTTKKNEETKTYVSDLFLDLRTQIFPRHSITSCHTDTLQNCTTTGITTATTTITHSFSIFQFLIQISLLRIQIHRFRRVTHIVSKSLRIKYIALRQPLLLCIHTSIHIYMNNTIIYISWLSFRWRIGVATEMGLGGEIWTLGDGARWRIFQTQ